MSPSSSEIVACSCFFGALLHSFSAQKIEALALRSHNPTLRTLLHFAGEIEVVFGLWATLFTLYCMSQFGFHSTMDALQQKSFQEPIFVFVIMVIAATRPIIDAAQTIITQLSRTLTLTYATTLILTPLLGSFITEPAAMTVAALLLKKSVLDHSSSEQAGGQKLLYSTVAALFVNISIGGTLTSFAAPPVLMVARIWNWDTAFMFSHFGWKSTLAVIINSIVCVILNRKTLISIEKVKSKTNVIEKQSSRLWIQFIHFAFLLIAILSAHYPVFLIGSLLFFVGFTQLTSHAQDQLKIREALLVSIFLGGLVVLTAEQSWWLSPILTSLSNFSLFLSAIGLTAITDNAAITSLAAQVNDLALTSKYAVIAGAVAGGGLTLIANAPNPAGYAILRDRFKNGGIQPLRFFFYALLPTLIAGVCLWIL